MARADDPRWAKAAVVTFPPEVSNVVHHDVVDAAGEAGDEWQVAVRAERDLRDALHAARTLFGDHLADELGRHADRALGAYASSVGWYLQAVGERNRHIAELEAQLAERSRRCTVLGRDLTDEMAKRAKADDRLARQAEKIEHLATLLAEEQSHAWAAVRWAKRSTRKKTRPAWLASAVELLSLRDDGR